MLTASRNFGSTFLSVQTSTTLVLQHARFSKPATSGFSHTPSTGRCARLILGFASAPFFVFVNVVCLRHHPFASRQRLSLVWSWACRCDPGRTSRRFRVPCTISPLLLLVQRLTLEEFVLGPRGWWSKRRLPVHRATSCTHSFSTANYRQLFSPLFRLKRRVHVVCPDLLGGAAESVQPSKHLLFASAAVSSRELAPSPEATLRLRRLRTVLASAS